MEREADSRCRRESEAAGSNNGEPFCITSCLVAYREYYTDMNYYKYAGEFSFCFVRMLVPWPGVLVSKFLFPHAFSKHSV